MIRLQAGPIRVDDLVRGVAAPADGAVSVFLGTVRDHNAGRTVRYLEYHAYAEMAHAEMERIVRESRERFGVSGIAVVHRTGRLEIGEISVGVAVAAHHRAESLQACRFLVDEIKKRVPIWKKEHFEGGEAWIEEPLP